MKVKCSAYWCANEEVGECTLEEISLRTMPKQSSFDNPVCYNMQPMNQDQDPRMIPIDNKVEKDYNDEL